jgi:hypothetical protein
MWSFAVVASGGLLSQALQVVGALGVLAPFAAAQFGVLSTRSRAYLLLNVAGSTLLAVLAAVDEQYGFLLLEGVWALVSAWGLVSLTAGCPPRTRGHSPGAPRPARYSRRRVDQPSAAMRSRSARADQTNATALREVARPAA